MQLVSKAAWAEEINAAGDSNKAGGARDDLHVAEWLANVVEDRLAVSPHLLIEDIFARVARAETRESIVQILAVHWAWGQRLQAWWPTRGGYKDAKTKVADVTPRALTEAEMAKEARACLGLDRLSSPKRAYVPVHPWSPSRLSPEVVSAGRDGEKKYRRQVPVIQRSNGTWTCPDTSWQLRGDATVVWHRADGELYVQIGGKAAQRELAANSCPETVAATLSALDEASRWACTEHVPRLGGRIPLRAYWHQDHDSLCLAMGPSTDEMVIVARKNQRDVGICRAFNQDDYGTKWVQCWPPTIE